MNKVNADMISGKTYCLKSSIEKLPFNKIVVTNMTTPASKVAEMERSTVL
jgi:hypothetical protein